MKLTILISMALVFGLFIIIFYKIIRVNKILPISSWQERRNIWAVEGETLAIWAIVPPLWKRLLGPGALFILIAAWGYLGYLDLVKEQEQARHISLYLYLPLMVAAVVFQQYRPRIYRITPVGLWRKQIGVFTNPEKAKGKEERSLRWEDVAGAEFTAGKVVLKKRTSQAGGPYALPTWLSGLFSRFELILPDDRPEVEALLRKLTATAG